MTRPTQTSPGGVVALRDQEAADWLDANPRCALLFWDASDARCRELRARLEVVAAATDVAVGVLDVRSDALVAQALGVASVPAVVVFRGGEVTERLMGVVPENILAEAFG